ncbi:sprouty-related, EVH1 domain-containing protein 2-like [Acanthaster planci]|uniref:Sprouty-related, EVH1 domain-containing protein 2-like n=1 Tax=Acanthaster planci TaxID=133434 RepID=A0A8B7YBB1_ACAPL|nr:sprouty-related, EVH1 domain-containing protein 2-like [Acanthaster planci]
MEEKRVDEDSCLIRVKAQVMTRTEEGWGPLGNGGYGIVGIYRLSPETKKVEYMIVGTNSARDTRLMNCLLRRDVEYNKPTPTFRHWRTQDSKFGLTFSNPSDARAFDRGFARVVQELDDGASTESSLNQSTDNEVDDDPDTFPPSHVGEPLLCDPSAHEYQNTPGSNQRESLRDILMQPTQARDFAPQFNHHSNQQRLHRVHYVSRSKSVKDDKERRLSNSNKKYSSIGHETIWTKKATEFQSQRDNGLTGENGSSDPYVKILKKPPHIHEYVYPMVLGSEGEDDLRKPRHHLKVVTSQPRPPSPPVKANKVPLPPDRVKCVHCQQFFNPETNRRGACPDAPDETDRCIGKVSCIQAAQSMMYHCMADAEGDFSDPCSCDASADTHFCQRWLGLGLLSLFVPCLWCYLPLKCCHLCGMKCGCCGGKHKAI